MSAQAFLLALLMWQFEGCDYVSQVTDGRRGGLCSVCLSRVINDYPAKHACLHSCVTFAMFCVEMSASSANVCGFFFFKAVFKLLQVLPTPLHCLFLLILLSDLIFSRF